MRGLERQEGGGRAVQQSFPGSLARRFTVAWLQIVYPLSAFVCEMRIIPAWLIGLV